MDKTILLDHVLIAIPATLMALATLLTAIATLRQTKRTHAAVNGMTEARVTAAHAEGRQEERDSHETD